MKILPHFKPRSPGAAGFTLVEVMVSMWIFIIVFIGVLVAVQVFGLRVYTLSATKISATASALKVLNQIRDDIRGANQVNVGTVNSGGASSFTLTGPTNKNVGNALQIFPTTNSTPYTIYYLDISTGSNCLRMASTPDGSTFTNTALLASFITNNIVFDAEDCRGNILTNDANNRIIRMELDFYQWEYPIGVVGGAGLNAYDFFKVTTKITRRKIDYSY